MNNSSLTRPLRGIIPPMVTPLRDRDTLDCAGLERLIEHIIGGGAHGLFILGTSGEAPNLSHRVRRELIDKVCLQVKHRVPVLVGITDTSFVESVALAQYAADTGAEALVTAAPYYFPAGQPELIEFAERLTAEMPLPLFLYNMPQMTKLQFEPATLLRLTQLPGIAGVKDSSGDLTYFDQVLEVAKQRPDWSVLVGPEQLLAQTMACGGHGGVCGGANVWPKLFVDLFDAVSGGRPVEVARLEARLNQFGEIYRVGRHASAVVKGLKCSLALLGLCDDFMAEPFTRFHEPERQRVRAVLQNVGLLPA
jgi:2-dehydro-3-deoxy-D-pentonate aldolase